MRLILLRHAKSEKAEAGQRDHARRLNARGRDDAPVIGAYMARHGLVPDRALVSSAARTRETWERVAATLAARPQVIHEERLYDASSEAILALVRSARPGPEGGSDAKLIAWGPGPRASQALMLAVRAKALIDGRYAPSVDDVVELAEPVLKHRMALTFAARADGETIEAVVGRLKTRIG